MVAVRQEHLESVLRDARTVSERDARVVLERDVRVALVRSVSLSLGERADMSAERVALNAERADNNNVQVMDVEMVSLEVVRQVQRDLADHNRLHSVRRFVEHTIHQSSMIRCRSICTLKRSSWSIRRQTHLPRAMRFV